MAHRKYYSDSCAGSLRSLNLITPHYSVTNSRSRKRVSRNKGGYIKTLDLSLSASIMFDKYHQKNCSFQYFLAKFISLAKKCEKVEEQEVEALKKVSEPIAKAFNTLYTSLPYNNFTAWATKCQTFYDNQQEYEFNHQLQNIPCQPVNIIPTLTQPRLPTGSDTMDLDTLNKTKTEEWQYCYTNGLYFYCCWIRSVMNGVLL